MVPLLPSSEYLFWLNREIHFASIRPLGRIASYKAVISSKEQVLPDEIAPSHVERALLSLSEIVPFEERFIFHVQAAIVRATFRPRPSSEANHKESHDFYAPTGTEP